MSQPSALAKGSAVSLEDVGKVSPALVNYTVKAIMQDLWKREGLSPRDRSLISLSALITRNSEVAMLYYVNAALDNGLKPLELSELVTHLAFYAGWPNAFAAVVAVKEVFAQRGIGAEQLPGVAPTLLPLSSVVPEEEFRQGFINGNIAPLAPGFAQFTNDLLYHEVWLRPDLSPRDRSLATVASMIAAGDTLFLELYLNRAIGHGLTRGQIGEMLTQLSFYIGWPKVVAATLSVKTILERKTGETR